MTSQIGGVSLNGIFEEDKAVTFLISGTVTADDEGKPVTIDSGAANTVKLAGDNDVILGRLERYEDRVTEGIKLAAVSMGLSYQMPVNPDASASPTDETPAVGDYVCGATKDSGAKGYVQKIANGGQQKWLVVELLNSGADAVVMKV